MFTQQVPGHVGASGVATQHKRISASTAAALGALVSGGVPYKSGISGESRQYPSVVWLSVEIGATQTVYYTVDGSTPSATNGMVVPVQPAQILLPYPDLLKNTGTVTATNQQIQLYAAGATNVQCLFEYW